MNDRLNPMISDELKRTAVLLKGAQELFISIDDIENIKYSECGQSMNYNAHFLLLTAIDNLLELSDTLESSMIAKGAA